jgi:hypothetical protein
MPTIQDFFYQYEGAQKQILSYLHQKFTEELNLIDKIRYDIPFYYGKSWICYLNPNKKGGVELAFVRGNELSNEQGLLDNKGRKQVYSLEFTKLSDIPKQALNEILQEAILLDETIAYESKRKKG